MNILILVLSARTQPWGRLMECSMETWDAEKNENTKTLYYCGTGGRSTDAVFYSQRWTEELQDVSARTMEAFEMSLEFEWQYLARPNSSCYVHKRNLVNFCNSLPKENVIRGVMSGGVNPFMWGGCHYVFSRDVVENMVKNKEKWNAGVMDDNSITLLLQALGYELESNGWCASINLMPDGQYLCMTYNHGDNFIFTDWVDIKKAEGHFFFRVKHDPDRSVDIKHMKLLHEHFK